jgi:FkbM family methyltransferase
MADTKFFSDMLPFFYRIPVLYVDVGAHKGEMYKLALQSGLAISEAHLVEPNQRSSKALRELLEQTEFSKKKSHIYPLALGSRAGRVVMCDGDDMTKVVDQHEAEAEAASNVFEAEVLTLDNLSRVFTRQHINILKVDVEGFELEVLGGATELLGTSSVDVIYIEAGLDPLNKRQIYYRNIEDHLNKFGYRLFKIYEQTNDWQTDSPLLRRVNMAFMSAQFVRDNPYRLSKDLFNLQSTLQKERANSEKSLQGERTRAEEAEEARMRLERTLQEERTKAEEAEEARMRLERALQEERTKAEEAEEARMRLERVLQEERVKAEEVLQDALEKAERSLQDSLKAANELVRTETVERVKSHLSYRIGSEIIQSRSPMRFVGLPWRLIKAYSSFKLRQSNISQGDKIGSDESASGAHIKKSIFGNRVNKDKISKQSIVKTKKKIFSTKSLTASELSAENFRSTKGQFGQYAVVAMIEKQRQAVIDDLDEDEYQFYILSLCDCREYQRCAAVFEQRYGNSSLAELSSLKVEVLNSYIRSLLRSARWEFALEFVEGLIQSYPDQWQYWFFKGYIQAGHNSSQARISLRTAIRLGDKSPKNLLLIYLTLLKEKKFISEINADIGALGANGLRNLGNHDSMFFIRSTVALDRGAQDIALRELNAYLGRHGLSKIRLRNPDYGFGIDNFISAQQIKPIVKGPLLSVLMTTYNSSRFLDIAVASVVEQTYRNLELLIVDDCSSDDTREKLADWERRDSRIRVLHNQHNVGTYGSKNLALLFARGDFLTCHDSDDWSHPEKMARQMECILDSNAIACTSKWVRIDERGYFESMRWGEMLHLNASSLLYRREVVDAIGYYDTVKTGADTEFQQRIVHKYGLSSIKHMPFCMAFGRSHSESLTRLGSLGFDEFGASPLRQQYWAAWGAWHRQVIIDGREQFYVGFPPMQTRQFQVPAEILPDWRLVRLNVEAAR